MIIIKTAYGIIAQLGEHLPYKQRVIGSSPIGPTNMNYFLIHCYAGVAELADAQDLKSCGTNLPYRFDSGRRQLILIYQNLKNVCLAQLDRASGYGPEGREFESSSTRQRSKEIALDLFYFIGRCSKHL